MLLMVLMLIWPWLEAGCTHRIHYGRPLAFDAVVTPTKGFDAFCLSFYAFDGFDMTLTLAGSHTVPSGATPWI